MANKKITELPLIPALSGSQNGGTVIPVVVGGTTAQISAENFSRFVNAYNAHTGSAGNTFAGPQTINSTLSVSGNTTIGGTLIVAGRLTAEEFHTEITTASVIYSSGSTKFGDTSNDTHEFTGSIQIGGETLGNAGLNAFTASAGLQLSRIYQATASIQAQTASLLAFTASQDGRNFTLSQVTGSFRGEIGGLEAYSASLKTAAIVSSSTQVQNYDLFALNSNVYTSTGSIKGEIAGLEAYTSSLKSQTIVSSSTQVQNYDVFALNSNLYESTGSIKGEIAGLEAYTSSLKAAISVSGTNVQIIGDLNVNKLNVQYISSSVLVTSGSNIFGDQSTDKHEFTGSVYLQNSLILGTEVLGNAGLNSFSSSLIGITNDIMALTASLKSVAIVSSSQQIQNYNTFAVTSSNNTYYGENTFTNKVTHTNGYLLLTQVSQSLNFVDDTAAAAGGVPLGGLYRNGNFIVIRIV